MTEPVALPPIEARDSAHLDHELYYQTAGQCFAGPCEQHREEEEARRLDEQPATDLNLE